MQAFHEAYQMVSKAVVDTFVTDSSSLYWQFICAYIVMIGIAIKLGLGFDYADLRTKTHSWRKSFFPAGRLKELRVDFLIIIYKLVFFQLAARALGVVTLRSGLEDKLELFRTRFQLQVFHVSQNLFTDLLFVFILYVVLEHNLYWMHRIQHKNKYLWRFHKVHHNTTMMGLATGSRHHPMMSLFLGMIPDTIGTIFVTFVFYCLVGELPRAEAFGWATIGYLGSQYFSSVLIHSNVWWSWGKLDYIFNNSALHMIHHSKDEKHYDKNFSCTCILFDVLYGTFEKPTHQIPEGFQIGLDEKPVNASYANFGVNKLMWYPFFECYQVLKQDIKNWRSSRNRGFANDRRVQSLIEDAQSEDVEIVQE